MSLKVFFIASVLIGSLSVSLAATALENATVLESLPLQLLALGREIFLQDKQFADKEIENILFGKVPNIHECLNVTFVKRHLVKQQNNTKDGRHRKHDKPLWTAVVLKEEVYQNKTFNIQQCAGSLIHSNVVLTAAHCMFNKSLTDLKVRAGLNGLIGISHKNVTSYQERRIKKVVFRNGYNIENPKNDIALIFLNDSFKLSAQLKTVCLPTVGALNLTYVRCSVSGWERNSKTNSVGHKSFKKVNMTVVPSHKCEKVLRMTALANEFTLHGRSMCASAHSDQTILNGNGGAPLLCPICGVNGRMIQVGVSSWGFNVFPLPEVFTPVSYFHNWIRNELRKRKMKLPDCGIRWE